MPLRFNVAQRQPFLVVKVTGLAFLDHAERLLEQVAREACDAGSTALLLDFTDIVGTLALHDRCELARLLAAHVRGVRKVAAVCPEGHSGLMSEAAAAEGGLSLKVFASRAEANAWLLA